MVVLLRWLAFRIMFGAGLIKLRGDATVHMVIEGQPQWRADASFDGDLDEVPLTAILHEPFRADMAGRILALYESLLVSSR